MLEPTPPREAVTDYLDDISNELAATTVANHRYRLEQFLEWTDQAGIDNMNDVTGRKLQSFKVRKQGDVAKVTLKNHLSTVRQFIEFCEDTNTVPTGVARKIRLPTMQLGEDVNDTFLHTKEADLILDYCEDYGLDQSECPYPSFGADPVIIPTLHLTRGFFRIGGAGVGERFYNSRITETSRTRNQNYNLGIF